MVTLSKFTCALCKLRLSAALSEFSFKVFDPPLQTLISLLKDRDAGKDHIKVSI